MFVQNTVGTAPVSRKKDGSVFQYVERMTATPCGVVNAWDRVDSFRSKDMHFEHILEEFKKNSKIICERTHRSGNLAETQIIRIEYLVQPGE